MDRNVLVGMTTGASIMFGFGIAWLLIGVLVAPSSTGLRLALLLAGIALGVSVAIMGWRASRLPRGTVPPTAEQIAAGRAIGRRFGLIFGLETVAILLAVAALNGIHRPDYIPCAIAVIVGLHFFPLAPLFKAPIYNVTGFLGCVIGLAGVVVADAVFRQEVVSISFGLLLWATTAWIAWKGLVGLRQIASGLPRI
ncbi:MAG: hypothetical protein WBV60_04685 [Terriglobales bacterium]